MNEYNVNEFDATENTTDEVADEIENEIDEVTEVANESVSANDVNLADLVEQNEDNQATDGKKSPLFDNLSLFIIMMVIGFVVSIAVCHLFGNWYLGFILGGYIGTALGLAAIFIRKFGLTK